MTGSPLELEPSGRPRPGTPAADVPVGAAQARGRVLIGSCVRGDAADPSWVRPALFGVALLAAVLYLWDLTISGYANEYYSAAALAASKSWSAWFFGSFDAANFITVDKPPVALWVIGLSVRIFGLGSWSILLPEAIAGIATVVLLFFVVRRSFGPVAGLLAALVTALTPAAVLMFRYDNPDAVLTLLLVLAAWAFVRGLEDGATKWVVAAGAFVGLAFLTKYLQAYLVLPAFAITYAIAAPGSVGRRVEQLVAAAATVTITSLWWVLIVELLPTSMRPFIGGSANDSVLNLLFGYDGLGRILGRAGPGPGGTVLNGGGPGAGFAGETGILRLLNDQFAGQIAWLLPLAAIGFVVGLWVTRRAPRTDRRRAGYLMWGLWLGVHAFVFSFMSGIVHTYYVVAMAPAIGALVGGGLVDLWGLRSRSVAGGALLGAALVATAALGGALLARTPDFAPGLGAVALVVVGIAALVVAVPAAPSRRTVALLATGAAVVAILAGPASYALATVGTAYGGGDPRAGPATAADRFGGGFGGRAGPAGLPGRGGFVGGFRSFPGGVFGGVPGGVFGGGSGSVGGPGGVAGGPGDVAGGAFVDYLVANRGDATWIVAVDSANEAAPIQLATGEPVMAMGGFSGGDPAPTVGELKEYVRSGELRFVLLGGPGGRGFGAGPVFGGGLGGGTGLAGVSGSAGADDAAATPGARAAWVVANCSAVDPVAAGTPSLYDCAAAAGS